MQLHADDQTENRDEIWQKHIDEIKTSVPWLKQIDAYERFLHSYFSKIEESKELDEHRFFSEREFQSFSVEKMHEITQSILKGEISPGIAMKRTDLSQKLAKFGTSKLVEENQTLYNAIKGIERKMNLNETGMKLKLDETVQALKVGGDKSGLLNFFKNRPFDNLCLQHLGQELKKTFGKVQIQEAVNKFLLLESREVNANIEKEVERRKKHGENEICDGEDVSFLEKVNGNHFLCHRCGAGHRKLHNAVLHSLICLARGKVTLTCLYCPHQFHGWDLSAYVYKRHIEGHIAELEAEMETAGNPEAIEAATMKGRNEPPIETKTEISAVPKLFDVPLPGPAVPLFDGSSAHTEQKPGTVPYIPKDEHFREGPPNKHEVVPLLGQPSTNPKAVPLLGGPPVRPHQEPFLGGPAVHPHHESLLGSPPARSHQAPLTGGPPVHHQHEPLIGGPPVRPQHEPLLGGPPVRPNHEPSIHGPPVRPQHESLLGSPPVRPQHQPLTGGLPVRHQHQPLIGGLPVRPQHEPLLAGPAVRHHHEPLLGGPTVRPQHDPMIGGPPVHPQHRPLLGSPPLQPEPQPLLGGPSPTRMHGPGIAPLFGDTSPQNNRHRPTAMRGMRN